MKKMHLICNAHIDPVWQWQWQEGAGAAISTFRMATRFCREYDELIFCHNEALLYEWMEEYEPELFKEIQALVKEGKWHIMGGWYLQPDCNLPSGEGIVRNVLAGRRYFEEKFGKRPTTAINFDPFGHSRGLVQIMAKSGFDSYLITRPSDVWLTLPGELFKWEGYDGSSVMVGRSSNGYSTLMGKATEKMEGSIKALKDSDKDLTFFLWGVGNHGGGPSRVDLDAIRKKQPEWEKEGVKVIHSTPEDFFAELRSANTKLPSYQGDLNPWAVGCYTSQVRIKQQYRKLESSLFMCEKMCAALSLTRGLPYPAKELAEAQHDLLVAQFHDILPGSSVKSAEADGLQMIHHGLETLSKLQARAFFAACKDQSPAAPGEIPMLAFNPHPYPVEADLCCEFMLADQNWDKTFTDVAVFCGKERIPSQIEKEESNIPLDWRKKVVFHTVLPPMQITRFDCKLITRPEKPIPTLPCVDDHLVYDDGHLKLTINCKSGLIDLCRLDGIDQMKPDALSLDVFEDDEDPWGMRYTGWHKKIGSFTLLSDQQGSEYSKLPSLVPSVRVLEDGEVRSVVEALFGYGSARAVVRYTISKLTHTLDVHIDLLNTEPKRLYKLAIPFAGESMKAVAQVIYGEEEVVRGRENVLQKFVRLTDEKNAGCRMTVFNRGSYGCSLAEDTLHMTLMRSPSYTAHPVEDRAILPTDRHSAFIEMGERSFDFRLSFGEGQYTDAIIAQMYHEEPTVLSFFPSETDKKAAPNIAVPLCVEGGVVLVSAFKKAEVGEAYILRLFNPTKETASCKVTSDVLAIEKEVSLSPFAVVTFRLEAGSMTPCPLTEQF